MLFLKYFFKNLDNQLNHFWDAYYLLDDKLGEQNPMVGQVSELRRAWLSATKIYANYQHKTQSALGLIKSFVPLTPEFHLRSHLYSTITVTASLLQEVFSVTHRLTKRLTVPKPVKVSQTAAVANANISHVTAKQATKTSSARQSWPAFFEKNKFSKGYKSESFYQIKTHNNKPYFVQKKMTH